MCLGIHAAQGLTGAFHAQYATACLTDEGVYPLTPSKLYMPKKRAEQAL